MCTLIRSQLDWAVAQLAQAVVSPMPITADNRCFTLFIEYNNIEKSCESLINLFESK